MKLKTLIHLVVFICGFAVLTFLLAVCISMCSCRGKNTNDKSCVKYYADTSRRAGGLTLKTYNDSIFLPTGNYHRRGGLLDSIVHDDSSKWIRRTIGGDMTPHLIVGSEKDTIDNWGGYGYAGIQKAGEITFRNIIIRFGVDKNGIRRLMMTYEKDSILTGIPGVGNWGETATITRISDTTKPTINPLFRKGEIYYFDTALRILKGIKDDSKD